MQVNGQQSARDLSRKDCQASHSMQRNRQANSLHGGSVHFMLVRLHRLSCLLSSSCLSRIGNGQGVTGAAPKIMPAAGSTILRNVGWPLERSRV